MSSGEVNTFNDYIRSQQLSHKKFKLTSELVWYDEKLGAITVPEGYEWDGASIQSLRNTSAFIYVVCFILAMITGHMLMMAFIAATIFLALYSTVAGYGFAASCVHDFLYDKSGVSRFDADAVLYRALRYGENENVLRCDMFWLGVRAGGWPHYKEKVETPIPPSAVESPVAEEPAVDSGPEEPPKSN